MGSDSLNAVHAYHIYHNIPYVILVHISDDAPHGPHLRPAIQKHSKNTFHDVFPRTCLDAIICSGKCQSINWFHKDHRSSSWSFDSAKQTSVSFYALQLCVATWIRRPINSLRMRMLVRIRVCKRNFRHHTHMITLATTIESAHARKIIKSISSKLSSCFAATGMVLDVIPVTHKILAPLQPEKLSSESMVYMHRKHEEVMSRAIDKHM